MTYDHRSALTNQSTQIHLFLMRKKSIAETITIVTITFVTLFSRMWAIGTSPQIPPFSILFVKGLRSAYCLVYLTQPDLASQPWKRARSRIDWRVTIMSTCDLQYELTALLCILDDAGLRRTNVLLLRILRQDCQEIVFLRLISCKEFRS